MVSLLEDGLAASTVAWHLRMVTPFFQWAWQHHHITAEDLMRIRTVKPPRGYNSQDPRPYSRKELRRMWAELDAKFPYAEEHIVKRYFKGTSPFHGRLRRHAMRLQLDAIIDLALVCGLRRNEIYTLAIDDVHWDNQGVIVHGKREDQHSKVRDVPMSDSTRAAVRAWFRMRAALSPEPGLPLWLSVTGPNPSLGLRQARMATILHSFGDWTLHRLRHTCATERLRGGMELEQLQKFLGHSNISMTLRYAKLNRGDIHRAAERTDAEFQRAIKPHLPGSLAPAA
jgi:integrase